MAGVGHTPFVPVSGLASRFPVLLPSPHELPAAISLSTRPRVDTVCSRVPLLSREGAGYSTSASESSCCEWLLEYPCRGVT
jgi:hypothetical protein